MVSLVFLKLRLLNCFHKIVMSLNSPLFSTCKEKEGSTTSLKSANGSSKKVFIKKPFKTLSVCL